jgi:beta-lactamase regulating signal transducer with metallopeptidase domain
VDTLLHVGLGNAVAATALAILAAVVGRCGRRPALVHSLWLLVLLKLVTPPLIHVPLPWPAVAAGESPHTEEAPALLVDWPREEESTGGLAEGALQPAPEAPAPLAPAPAGASLPWQVVVFAVWAGGALVWWGTAALRLVRFHRLLRQVPAAPPDVCERAAELAALLGLRRRPSVWYVAGPLSPMLLAVAGAPRILLPSELWERLSAEQRDALLLHELAHLKRGDHWVRRLELLVLGLYWWCPVAWWACRALQSAEEECCDAWVVWALPEGAPAYAAALVETVAFLSRARGVRPVGASSAAHVPLLKRRLSMILSGKTPRRLSRAALVAVVLLGAGLLPLLPSRAEAPRDAAPDRPGETAERKADSPVAADRPRMKGMDLTGCVACHAVVSDKARKRPDDWKHAHDEVVRLLAKVKADRDKARDTEQALRAAIKWLEAMQRADKEKAISPEKRLEEMEKKLDALLKDMEALRRELKRARPSSQSAPSSAPTTMYVRRRSFFLPVQVGPDEKVRELLLYTVYAQGQVASLVARAEPGSKGFRFTAPHDGTYRFVVVPAPRDGEPAHDVLKVPPAVIVVVDTVRPTITARANRAPDGTVSLSWTVRDAHLDLSSFKVEHRARGAAEWAPWTVAPAASGHIRRHPGTPGPVEVRLSVKDLAGNHAEQVLSVPQQAPPS